MNPSEEEKLLAAIFNEETPKWKGHEITWCNLCETFSIVCEFCKNSSCNCGGCDKCADLWKEWSECKTQPESYLNEEERKTAYKIRRLMKWIPMSLSMGHKEIDWQEMEKSGQYCRHDWDIFEFEKMGLTNSWE